MCPSARRIGRGEVTAPRPAFQRYAIPTDPAPDVVRVPPRFRVKVTKYRLAALAIGEVIHARGNMRVALSRPCMYGVFGRPVGVFGKERNRIIN